ncbi:hypothetical protein BpHYR1_013020 [Brachionus plicatilis]|uniref:Uncharacterized protein n=1 Tax=Brachionus plicatilis TaxID=10195 RepID=A0A3M7R1E5_BRAPC|nr:hypothetical protein BpHYR1_013020 [Brachionus plicatilis]
MSETESSFELESEEENIFERIKLSNKSKQKNYREKRKKELKNIYETEKDNDIHFDEVNKEEFESDSLNSEGIINNFLCFLKVALRKRNRNIYRDKSKKAEIGLQYM